MRSLLISSLALVLLVPAVAAAAQTSGPELTFGASVRWGQATFPVESTTPHLILCVTTPCVLADASTEEAEVTPTLILDVPLSPRWAVETLLTRHEGEMEFQASFPVSDHQSYDLTTLLVGLQRQWEGERVRPFVAGGVGYTWLEFGSGLQVYDRPIFPGIIPTFVDGAEGLATSLAAGVKVPISPRWAARIEGRVIWSDLPERLGGTLQQDEIGVGLTYRF
ncbi:MAG: outer membrane beta-barrel protein [Thermoanaerobaculia bacterium]|nr:outer membrane beta-barrel protein [Thermoanaerobaculia bacterium]